MPSQSAEPPVFLIVAGANGSGKSSAYAEADIEAGGRSIWIINPDALAARICSVEKIDLATSNLQAVCRIEAWLAASIDAYQTIGVETVLSTAKYRYLVDRAKRLGFEIWMIHVSLDVRERNVERVKLRVKKGGHAVPVEKILEKKAYTLTSPDAVVSRAGRPSLAFR